MNTKVMYLVLFIFMPALTFGAQNHESTEIDEYEVQNLMFARDSATLLRVQLQLSELKSEIAACKIQQGENLLPTRCYVALDLSNQLKLKLDDEFQPNLLFESCLKIAGRTQQLTEIDFVVLPKECEKKAKATIALNRYKNSGHDY